MQEEEFVCLVSTKIKEKTNLTLLFFIDVCVCVYLRRSLPRNGSGDKGEFEGVVSPFFFPHAIQFLPEMQYKCRKGTLWAEKVYWH